LTKLGANSITSIRRRGLAVVQIVVRYIVKNAQQVEENCSLGYIPGLRSEYMRQEVRQYTNRLDQLGAYRAIELGPNLQNFVK